MNNLRRKLLLAGCASLTVLGGANAGGFDRGGVNIDQLFDSQRFSGEAGVTYVSPQRTIRNVDRLPAPPLADIPTAAAIDVEGDYVVPRVGLKANLFEPVDCLASYTEPYGADAGYGRNNAYSPTAVEFSVDTNDFGLTCSYKFDVGKGHLRVIGGVSYQELDAFLSRQTLLGLGNTGIGTFQLSDSAWGYRIGAAYEMPEIALRASLVYSSRYKYDELAGTVNTTGFAGGPTGPSMGAFLGVRPVTASSEIPQAVEFKVQSGIAPGWLAFGSIKWQEWSRLRVIPINGVISPVFGTPSAVSFDPLYRDGWTITGGIGHKFSDMISGAASIAWDRGTSTVSGYQTDSWNFSAGASITPNENVEMRVGGSIGILTSGTSSFAGVGDTANRVTYSFDDDLLLAGSASLKIRF